MRLLAGSGAASADTEWVPRHLGNVARDITRAFLGDQIVEPHMATALVKNHTRQTRQIAQGHLCFIRDRGGQTDGHRETGGFSRRIVAQMVWPQGAHVPGCRRAVWESPSWQVRVPAIQQIHGAVDSLVWIEHPVVLPHHVARTIAESFSAFVRKKNVLGCPAYLNMRRMPPARTAMCFVAFTFPPHGQPPSSAPRTLLRRISILSSVASAHPSRLPSGLGPLRVCVRDQGVLGTAGGDGRGGRSPHAEPPHAIAAKLEGARAKAQTPSGTLTHQRRTPCL